MRWVEVPAKVGADQTLNLFPERSASDNDRLPRPTARRTTKLGAAGTLVLAAGEMTRTCCTVTSGARA